MKCWVVNENEKKTEEKRMREKFMYTHLFIHLIYTGRYNIHTHAS